MNETPYKSAIPSPDKTRLNEPETAPTRTPNFWKDAPIVVWGWAFPWMCLQVILGVLSMLTVILSDSLGGMKLFFTVLHILVLALCLWQIRNLKRRAKVGWTVQMVISYLGLLLFPVGTAVSMYILSQWFKPRTKAWFGRQ